MRLLALLPLLCSAAAVVLTFLCVFAGSSPDFMQSYDLYTFNVSRVGQNLVDEIANATGSGSSSSSSDSNNILGSLINNVTQGIENGINDIVNGLTSDVASNLGLEDFYAIHMMDFCSGYYEPGAVPNATLSAGDIKKNTTSCSNHTAMYTFDPRAALAQSLEKHGLDSNTSYSLASIAFPDDIEDEVKTFHTAALAMFVMYCMAIGFSFLCFFSSAAGLLLGEGRLIPFVNVLLFTLDFLVLLVASGISTAISLAIVDYVNKKGKGFNVQANAGGQFMALTWSATCVVFVGSVAWCVGCVLPRRRNKKMAVYKTG